MEASSSKMSLSTMPLGNQHTLLCACCNEPAAHKCSHCEGVNYCSSVCQHSDLESHQFVCDPDSELLSPPRNNMVRAFLFSGNKETVKIIWLPYHVDDTTGEHVLDTDKFLDFFKVLQPDGTYSRNTPECCDTISGLYSRHELCVWIQSPDPVNPTGPKAIIVTAEAWGPLESVEDVMMEDFADVIDMIDYLR